MWYWKMVSSLIHQRIGRMSHAERKSFHGDMPVIFFRLYTNGEAQLIAVERSSGNADMDRTAVLAVVDAHPFPRFPTGFSDSHMDVHVRMALPAP